MYRYVRYGGITPNATGIITHAQDNSSRIEINDKVFINANINPKETGTARSFFAHKNNDSMSFSWDPMQVVNLSRQEKAVCTREQNKLTSLERHFTRQSHLEHFKQSSLINKFRQRLARLNKLRVDPPTVKSHTEDCRGFPIVDPFPIRSRDIAVTTSRDIIASHNTHATSLDRNGLCKPTVKSGRLLQIGNGGQTGRSQIHGVTELEQHNRKYLGFKTFSQASVQPARAVNDRLSYDGGAYIKEGKISVRQIENHSPYERYPGSDKQRVISNEDCKFTLREVKPNGSKPRLECSKSDSLNTGENKAAARRSSVRLEYGANSEVKQIKSVRFHTEHVTQREKNKLVPGEFKKLVQLSRYVQQSKRK